MHDSNNHNRPETPASSSGRRITPDEIWAQVRDAYLAGLSAPECRRLSGGDLDRIELCQLTFVAHRRMLRAVMRGDAVEALRWRRVRLVMDAEEAEMDRLGAQQEAIFTARREAVDAAASDASDGDFRAAG
jgi:hypothetical protein